MTALILFHPQSGSAIRSKFAGIFLPTDGKAGLRMNRIQLPGDSGNASQIERVARRLFAGLPVGSPLAYATRF